MSGGTGVLTIDGRRLAYRRAGNEGPPVVLLHGGGVDDSLVSWRHAIDALADGYRVYAPDWPGYGDSDDGIDHDVVSYRRVLRRFVDSLGLESVSIVGISMGGAAALGYALAHEDRVDRLGLVDSYGLGRTVPNGAFFRATASLPGVNALGWAAMGLSDETARMALSGVVADASTLDDEFVADFRRRARRPGAGTAFDAFLRTEIESEGRARTNFVSELESLTVPTLLVHGAQDPLFPADWSRRAANLIPDATLRIVDDCGHWPTRERPDRFNETLSAFLSDE